MLYRVANLSKSSDKRIEYLTGINIGKNRVRGLVGEVTPVSDILPKVPGYTDYDGLFFLSNINTNEGGDFGVYRAEELEEVTEKQLDLEAALGALLKVFPNQSPSAVLDVNTTDEFDGFAVETLVPMIRKQFKKELSLDYAFGQQDSGF